MRCGVLALVDVNDSHKRATSRLQRLLFKTRMKLARAYLAKGNFAELGPLLDVLQSGLQVPTAPTMPVGAPGAGSASAEDAKGKATQQLELFALRIQMYTGMKGECCFARRCRCFGKLVVFMEQIDDNSLSLSRYSVELTPDLKQLAAVHYQALAVMRSAVPHPVILGVIHE
jgi:hypothetical protein